MPICPLESKTIWGKGNTLISTFKILLLLIAAISSLACLAQDGDPKSGFIGRLDVTTQGVEKMIKIGLEKGRPLLINLLQGLEIPSIVIGPKEEDCTPEKVKQMWFWQAWRKCPGIPEFFFKEGRWMESHRPHPVQMVMDSSVIKEIDMGNPVVSCIGKDCTVRIPIKKFVMGQDLRIQSLKTKQDLFKAEGLDIRVTATSHENQDENEDEDEETGPYLQLKVNLNSKLPIKDMVKLDENSAQLYLGAAQVHLSFDEDEDPIEFGTGDRGGEEMMRKYTPYIGRFDNFENFKKFMIMANWANQGLLRDPLVRNKIRNLVVDNVAPSLISIANKAVSDLFLFKEMDIPLPDLSLQNFLDLGPIQKGFKQVMEQTKSYQSEMTALQGHSLTIKDVHFLRNHKFKLLQKDIESFLDSLQYSTIPSLFNELGQLEEQVIGICTTLQSIERNQTKGKEYLDKGTQRCLETLNKIQESKMGLQDRIRKKSTRLHLQAFTKQIGEFGSPIKLQMSSRDYCDLPYVHEVDYEEEGHDASAEISLAAINSYLQKMHANGEFDICVNISGEIINCGNGNKDLRVTFPVPPKVGYDHAKNKLYFEIPEAKCAAKIVPGVKCLKFIQSNETAYARVYLDPKTCEGKICLNPEIVSRAKLFSKSDQWRNVFSALKFLTILHPILAHFIITSNVKGIGKGLLSEELSIPEIPIYDQLKLPAISVKNVMVSDKSLKFYFNLQ